MKLATPLLCYAFFFFLNFVRAPANSNLVSDFSWRARSTVEIYSGSKVTSWPINSFAGIICGHRFIHAPGEIRRQLFRVRYHRTTARYNDQEKWDV